MDSDSMKCTYKTTLRCRAAAILRSNDGTSIVLVTIIAIIIVCCVVILRTTTSALWASADRQYYQDQAYMRATSLGQAIDELHKNGEFPLTPGTQTIDGNTVTVTGTGPYTVTVTSKVGNAEYQYTATYSG